MTRANRIGLLNPHFLAYLWSLQKTRRETERESCIYSPNFLLLSLEGMWTSWSSWACESETDDPQQERACASPLHTKLTTCPDGKSQTKPIAEVCSGRWSGKAFNWATDIKHFWIFFSEAEYESWTNWICDYADMTRRRKRKCPRVLPTPCANTTEVQEEPCLRTCSDEERKIGRGD